MDEKLMRDTITIRSPARSTADATSDTPNATAHAKVKAQVDGDKIIVFHKAGLQIGTGYSITRHTDAGDEEYVVEDPGFRAGNGKKIPSFYEMRVRRV